MNETKNTLLSVQGLSVEYHTDDGVVYAVNDVSFTMVPGETLGLVGETGAGKTTIAKAILRILPEPPAKVTAGEITFEGQKLFELSEREMRKIRGGKISMVFQDPMTALNPVETVGSQISEAISLHEKLSRLEARRKASDLLEMVGISANRYEEYPHQFSGGMQQRVVIAMALACNPLLLLADEPTTALDVTIQAQVLDLMDELKKKYNTAMILITHDLGIVAQNCDRVGIVYAGEIMEIGSLEQIYDHHRHPYTAGLFGCIPNLNMTEKRLHPIPGLMPDPMNLPKGCPFAPRCTHATERCGERVDNVEVAPGHFVRCVLAAGEEAPEHG